MKQFILFLALCSSGIGLTAQNLVPNPSFEDTACFTQSESWTAFGALGWYNPNDATPDYYGMDEGDCYSNILSDFIAEIGEFQEPRTGDKMIGLFASISGGCSRDYVQCKLSEPLIAGGEYCVSMYVSLSNLSQICTDCFGLLLSTDSILTPDDYCTWEYTSSIDNLGNGLLNDTLNWVEISGSYIASGNEKFLTIGNFYDDQDCSVQPVNGNKPNFNVAYYFVDDVKVELCIVGQQVILKDEKPFIFPNPTTDRVYINVPAEGELKLYDLTGRLITTQKTDKGMNEIIFTNSSSGIFVVEHWIGLTCKKELLFVK